MTLIGKNITKRNEIACSSTSYTLFVFYALMFAMSLLCPYLVFTKMIAFLLCPRLCLGYDTLKVPVLAVAHHSR